MQSEKNDQDSESIWAKIKEKPKNKKHHKSEYVVAIIVNIFMLYVFNNLQNWLQNWHINLLANGWLTCLWVLNISITATIVGNFLLLFYDASWFRALIHFILNIFSIVVLYTFLAVFPFDLSSIWDFIIKAFIIFCIFGTIIASFVELTRMFAGLAKK